MTTRSLSNHTHTLSLCLSLSLSLSVSPPLTVFLYTLSPSHSHVYHAHIPHNTCMLSLSHTRSHYLQGVETDDPGLGVMDLPDLGEKGATHPDEEWGGHH